MPKRSARDEPDDLNPRKAREDAQALVGQIHGVVYLAVQEADKWLGKPNNEDESAIDKDDLQTAVLDVTHFVGIPAPEHLVHKAIIVGCLVASKSLVLAFMHQTHRSLIVQTLHIVTLNPLSPTPEVFGVLARQFLLSADIDSESVPHMLGSAP